MEFMLKDLAIGLLAAFGIASFVLLLIVRSIGLDLKRERDTYKHNCDVLKNNCSDLENDVSKLRDEKHNLENGIRVHEMNIRSMTQKIQLQSRLIAKQTNDKMLMIEAHATDKADSERHLTKQIQVLQDSKQRLEASVRKLSDNLQGAGASRRTLQEDHDRYKRDYITVRDCLTEMDNYGYIRLFNADVLRRFISDTMRAFLIAEFTLHPLADANAQRINIEAGQSFCDALAVGSYANVAVDHLFAVIGNALAGTGIELPLPPMFDTALSNEGTKAFMEQLGADYPSLHEGFKEYEYATLHYMQVASFIVQWFNYFPTKDQVEKILGNGVIATLRLALGKYSGIMIVPLETLGARYKQTTTDLQGIYKNIGLK